ncbi:MAG: guanylate kinase [Deltaproteobacteria bacterium]|nr:guanylate kinase [Deltaproteobacteria bacterium]
MSSSGAILESSPSHAKGRIFIVSAPSGAGKTTLCQAIRRHFPDMLYSVSHTTRPPRPGEIQGTDYHFIGKEEFIHLIDSGNWAEWAEVHGNYYGTSASFLDQGLEAGKDILLDIDVQGMLKILKKYPSSITVFIRPPSLETLRDRLESRGTDKPDIIETRMINAKKEMAQAHRYRHVIVNDDLELATRELILLIDSYRQNRPITRNP